LKFLVTFLFSVLLATASASAQILGLAPRATNALTGSQFINIILPMSQTSRENWILGQVAQGNIPGWQRNLVPITITKTINGVGHTLTYYAAPDYFAIGGDQDYFLEPMTPILAQRIANLLHCTLPTRLMVNEIWTNSAVKLTASTFNPNDYSIDSVPVFVLENTAVMQQRDAVTNSSPLGALVSGDKKDIIISTLIYTNFYNASVTKPVVIYGWIQPDGAPIQPEFNGHDESYMDYSHGVRLVQMAVTLDGAPNTVTNIIADPVLWPLLSDEGVVAQPYYTVDDPLAPFILTQPRSQNIKLGGSATFNLTLIGDPNLSYQWKFNGVTISGATNPSLTVTNAQSANSGAYTVVISNPYGTATNLPAILKVSTNAFPLLFSDSLSADTSANWNFLWDSADGVPDYTVNWAYDYGAIPYTFNGATFLIPPAPNTADGSTRGVKFTVNDTNGMNAAVNIYPRGQSFSGNFALKFDMWINYPGGAYGTGASGTTEYALCGIDHLGAEINWDATNPPATDGQWFAVDGEGGSTRDYRDYLGNPNGVETDLMGSASGLAAVIHTSSVFETLFSASRFESVGAPGKNWVAGEVDQTNGVVTWKLDGTIIAQRVNTSPFTSGDIMLGYMDIFPSIASPLANAFILFDNVRVEDWSSPPLQPPAIISAPQNQSALAGANVTFNVTATSAAPFTYQWTFNGANIIGATNSSLALATVQSASAGNYSVIVSNVVGSVISASAQLTVAVPPLLLGSPGYANGSFSFAFAGAIGSHYSIQTSSNLVDWTTLTAFVAGTNILTFADTNSMNFKNRFYRVTSP
jgi:hypothetical protein